MSNQQDVEKINLDIRNLDYEVDQLKTRVARLEDDYESQKALDDLKIRIGQLEDIIKNLNKHPTGKGAV